VNAIIIFQIRKLVGRTFLQSAAQPGGILRPTTGFSMQTPACKMRLSGVLSFMVLALLAPRAAALSPATLLTPQLEQQPIRLAGLQGGRLSYFDTDRRLIQRSAAEFVRLNLEHADDPPAGPSGGSTPLRVELVDGQVFVGRGLSARPDGDTLVFEHARLGSLEFAIDDLWSIRRPGLDPSIESPSAALPGGNDADRVTMRNGDRLAGFVVALDGEAVTLLPDGADEEVALPLAELAELTLANPAVTVEAAGDTVGLTDGSRVRGTGLAITGGAGGRLELTPTLSVALRPVSLPLVELSWVEFAASGLRLVDLADRPWRVTEGGRVWGVDWPARRDAGGLRLHAPATLRFDLPAGARRWSARAELDLPDDLPPERAGWADFVLRVMGSTETQRDSRHDAKAFHFTAERREAAINLPLAEGGEALVLQLDEGLNGPVLDRLRLREMRLLVRVPEPRPGSPRD
jgi:hypothetical protein